MLSCPLLFSSPWITGKAKIAVHFQLSTQLECAVRIIKGAKWMSINLFVSIICTGRLRGNRCFGKDLESEQRPDSC